MSTTTTTTSVDEQFFSIVPDYVTEMSPYKLAKVVSIIADKEVVPQMVYSYVRQGLIKSRRNELDKIVVTTDNALEWIKKYVGNKNSTKW